MSNDKIKYAMMPLTFKPLWSIFFEEIEKR